MGKCVGNPKCPCFISSRATGGSIIHFLSSNSRELIKKLNTMLAKFQARNNNVFNHILAIVDELRRQGILSINEIKKL
jgi:flagellar motor component MotA